MAKRLEALLPDLTKPRGRPAAAPPPSDVGHSLLRAAYEFLLANPGAAHGKGVRRIYGTAFRAFVFEQMSTDKPGATMTHEQVADTLGIPFGTLKSWLSPPNARISRDLPQPPAVAGPPPVEVPDPVVATIIQEFDAWRGGFTAFCEHLWKNHRVPYRRTFISSVLHALGRRAPKRRGGSKTPPWSNGTFRSFFPGFQWLADGKTVVLEFNGTRYAFNLEPIHDVAADATVGVVVTDTEDEAAVIAAYEQARAETGQSPLAFTIDNKPSNLSPAVEAAVAPAIIVPATPGRGQAKAPLEGAFGLLEQNMPPLVVQGGTSRELAASIVQLWAISWAWTRNHKPRRRLGGRTPAEVYLGANPTLQDVKVAVAYLAELQARLERFRRTREAAQDPVRRALLEEALLEFGIPDPKNSLVTAFARYAREAILRGTATFKAKRLAGTIPDGADLGRYLGGIIRNINDKLELELIGDHLFALRLRERDLALAHLTNDLGRLSAKVSPQELPQRLVERALEAAPYVDFRFWLRQARGALESLGGNFARAIARGLVGIAARAFKTARERREDLIAMLTGAACAAA
jgi:transposase InsO family protein